LIGVCYKHARAVALNKRRIGGWPDDVEHGKLADKVAA
jgi:hypothetical protein